MIDYKTLTPEQITAACEQAIARCDEAIATRRWLVAAAQPRARRMPGKARAARVAGESVAQAVPDTIL